MGEPPQQPGCLHLVSPGVSADPPDAPQHDAGAWSTIPFVSRCPVCGLIYPAGDRFCEADGATLVDETPSSMAKSAPPATLTCPHCNEGRLEADGFCSSCGRLGTSSRPTPLAVPSG